MDKLVTLYPQNVTRGSPYDTGTQNALTPEFKRIASILGDIVFQAPRRFFLNAVSEKQNTWSFCMLHVLTTRIGPYAFHSYVDSRTVSRRRKSVPILGSFHASDILNIYGGGDLTDSFATHLNPNGVLIPHWPRYTPSSPQLMTLFDSQVTNRTITLDTYRVEGIKFLTNLSLALL